MECTRRLIKLGGYKKPFEDSANFTGSFTAFIGEK